MKDAEGLNYRHKIGDPHFRLAMTKREEASNVTCPNVWFNAMIHLSSGDLDRHDIIWESCRAIDSYGTCARVNTWRSR
jgi:hypothetical protein